MLRVLYFTVIPLGAANEGGSICCRNHVSRLAADPGIDLTVLAVAPPNGKAATTAFLDELGVRHYFQPLQYKFHHSRNCLSSILGFATKAVFQFYWETKGMNQSHIQACIDGLIEDLRIDVLLIEWNLSALCVKLPRDDVFTAIIKQNREGDYYADMIKQGRTPHGSLTSAVSLWRARRFERATDSNVDKVIAIVDPDLPRYRLRSPPVCISPCLDENTERWAYTASKTLFFVGDIDRNPNNMAVKWIAQRLAPALILAGSKVQILIVGAESRDVPAEWRQHNIRFLGKSNDGEVRALFLTSDLVICPTETDYGIKIKALVALSYGTPLLASKQTILGLPYLKNMPSIDLQNATGAAQMISSLLADGSLLESLAATQGALQRAFIATQRTIWSQTLCGTRRAHNGLSDTSALRRTRRSARADLP